MPDLQSNPLVSISPLATDGSLDNEEMSGEGGAAIIADIHLRRCVVFKFAAKKAARGVVTPAIDGALARILAGSPSCMSKAPPKDGGALDSVLVLPRPGFRSAKE